MKKNKPNWSKELEDHMDRKHAGSKSSRKSSASRKSSKRTKAKRKYSGGVVSTQSDNKLTNKKYFYPMLIIIGVLVLVIAFIFRPAMIGFEARSQLSDMDITVSNLLQKLDLVNSDNLVKETELDTCKKLNENYISQISTEKTSQLECSSEISLLTSKVDQIKAEHEVELSEVQTESDKKLVEVETQLADVPAELNNVDSNIDNLELEYQSIIENSANNICCKAKVDDGSVDSYRITNSKIVCTIGEETKINC
ncbi:hypothetical protein HN587_07535 [Candidatus Woesearchaeota archaeon]|jgi:hypothetical protein|nr:hypothetical protein [Candidatus Woesearchaeota archaeon]